MFETFVFKYSKVSNMKCGPVYKLNMLIVHLEYLIRPVHKVEHNTVKILIVLICFRAWKKWKDLVHAEEGFSDKEKYFKMTDIQKLPELEVRVILKILFSYNIFMRHTSIHQIRSMKTFVYTQVSDILYS